MSRTKYVAHIAGKIVGTRNSSIPTTDKTYTHAIAVWGHGRTEHIVAWCSRFDLAQGERRKYERRGYTAEIVPVMILAPKAAKPTSWMAEVIADSSGKWAGNALRFATQDEAARYVTNLMTRWTSVVDTRVVESADPVNYAMVDGVATRLEA